MVDNTINLANRDTAIPGPPPAIVDDRLAFFLRGEQ